MGRDEVPCPGCCRLGSPTGPRADEGQVLAHRAGSVRVQVQGRQVLADQAKQAHEAPSLREFLCFNFHLKNIYSSRISLPHLCCIHALKEWEGGSGASA